MSRLTKFFIPVGSFILGGVGTYFALDSYEKRQEHYYSAFYAGLPEIQKIADPTERGRQLRKLRDLAENGYRDAFFRDVEVLIANAEDAERAESEAAAEAERQRLRAAQEAAEKAREQEARRLAELAEKRRREEEAARAKARAEALRMLEAEKVCRNPSCTDFILR